MRQQIIAWNTFDGTFQQSAALFDGTKKWWKKKQISNRLDCGEHDENEETWYIVIADGHKSDRRRAIRLPVHMKWLPLWNVFAFRGNFENYTHSNGMNQRIMQQFVELLNWAQKIIEKKTQTHIFFSSIEIFK